MEKDGGVSFSHVSDDVTDGGDHVSSGAEKLITYVVQYCNLFLIFLFLFSSAPVHCRTFYLIIKDSII